MKAIKIMYTIVFMYVKNITTNLLNQMIKYANGHFIDMTV